MGFPAIFKKNLGNELWVRVVSHELPWSRDARINWNWNCMQEITKLKTILEGFIKSFATQAKRKENNLLTMIDTHSYMYDCNQTIS